MSLLAAATVGLHSSLGRNQISWANWGAWRHIFSNLILDGAAFFAIVGGVVPIVRRWIRIPNAMVPLIAAGVFSTVGYVFFYIFLLGPVYGEMALWVAYGSALALNIREWMRYRRRIWEIWGGWDSFLMAALGIVGVIFYLSVLYLYQSSMGFSALAAGRTVAWALPGDNRINIDTATHLLNWKSIRLIDGGWHSSDRPPLETGVEILAAFRGGIGKKNASQFAMPLAGVFLQATWLFGTWAVVRQLGMDRRRAIWICLALFPSGFLYLNTLYIWPKLCAAAFSLGAYSLLLLQRERSTSTVVLASIFAALAMLSHGGAIFFLLPIAALLPLRWPGWRVIVPGMIAVLILYMPWVCYQKFYDPPGNHLLKMHLAGVSETDSRSALAAICESYATLGWQRAIQYKWENFITLFRGNWTHLFRFDYSIVGQNQADMFYYTLRSMGVLNIGWISLLWLVVRKIKERGILLSLLLIAGTYGMWCLVMFGPSTTTIHQGAYAGLLLMMILLLFSLLRVSAMLFAIVAVCNGVLFLIDYLRLPVGTSREIYGSLDAVSVSLLVLSVLAGCWLAIGQHWGEERVTIGPPSAE